MAERFATPADLPSEFDAVESRDLTFWLNVARARISLSVFGEDASIAHAMLAAHHLKKEGLGTSGSSRPVISERVGDVAVTYAAPSSGTTGQHGSTTYGQIFDSMLAGVCITPIAIRSDDEPHIQR